MVLTSFRTCRLCPAAALCHISFGALCCIISEQICARLVLASGAWTTHLLTDSGQDYHCFRWYRHRPSLLRTSTAGYHRSSNAVACPSL
ncbi:unnamed protein product [Ectocarpus sp. CCAP 1310/34]|nr:unnamed protein product [Ectocarpus sp. CCAP 1310/34]